MVNFAITQKLTKVLIAMNGYAFAHPEATENWALQLFQAFGNLQKTNKTSFCRFLKF